jgi:hypothetical protein
MPSKSKTSTNTFAGASSTAARTKALLYEPFLRLPAKARILNCFSIETTVIPSNRQSNIVDLKLVLARYPEFSFFEQLFFLLSAFHADRHYLNILDWLLKRSQST